VRGGLVAAALQAEIKHGGPAFEVRERPDLAAPPVVARNIDLNAEHKAVYANFLNNQSELAWAKSDPEIKKRYGSSIRCSYARKSSSRNGGHEGRKSKRG